VWVRCFFFFFQYSVNSISSRCPAGSCKNREGSKTKQPPDGWVEGDVAFTPADTNFSSVPGAANIPDGVTTPVQVYNLLIDDEVVAHILKESNEYAKAHQVITPLVHNM
jgi:hypothetical protein